MPKQKDLKRVVRTRMQKTGESYTAARVHVLAKRHAAAPRAAAPAEVQPPPPAAPEPRSTRQRQRATRPARQPAASGKQPPTDFAALAGMSDETIAAKTGCSWERWVAHLDHWGAAEKPHREIADHVHQKFHVPGWWAQAVTVGYERIRGLRAIGQRRGGAFEASKSKTVAAPVERLFAAFADARQRRRWLPAAGLVVRKATPAKSMRVTWDDGTSVELYFTAKGAGKSVVTVQHTKLPSGERAQELKRFWGERLEALAAQLTAN